MKVKRKYLNKTLNWGNESKEEKRNHKKEMDQLLG